jgi:hypothetical protein
MPAIPPHYSREFILLIESMLNIDPKKRPTANKILRDPFIKKNIMLFLERTKQKQQQLDNDNARNNSAIAEAIEPPSPQKQQQRPSSGKSEFVNLNRAQENIQTPRSVLPPQPPITPQPMPRSNYSIAKQNQNSESEPDFNHLHGNNQVNVKRVSSSASSADLIQPQRSSSRERGYDFDQAQRGVEDRPVAAAAAAPIVKSPVKKGVRISDVVQNIETKENIEISPKLSGAEYRERRLNRHDYENQEVEELELENDGEDDEDDNESGEDYDGPAQRKYELTKPIKLGNMSQSPVRRNNSENSSANQQAYQPRVKSSQK